MKMRERVRCSRPFIQRWLTILAVILSLYVASYVPFSMRGRYDVGSFGLNSIHSYSWYPAVIAVFDEAGRLKWNKQMAYFYYPMLALDYWFVHPPLSPQEYKAMNSDLSG